MSPRKILEGKIRLTAQYIEILRNQVNDVKAEILNQRRKLERLTKELEKLRRDVHAM